MKTEIIMGVIVLFLLMLSDVHAEALDNDCQIKAACNADEITVLSLEQPANSMAGLHDQYLNKVCCKGTMLRYDQDCDDPFNDIFIRLDKARNSHASYKLYSPTYAIPLCMSSYTSFGCFVENACSSGFRCVVDISMNRIDPKNAHIAACNTPGNYQRMCCGTIAVCGNGIVEPGEECDPGALPPPPLPAWDNFNHIKDCTYLDEFNDPFDPLTCGPTSCFINTTDCTKAEPAEAICGNGIIDINETCDGDNWGPNVNDCSWFDSFAGGELSCFPPGEYPPPDPTGNPAYFPVQCHFDTTGCLPGFYPTPMICGRVNHTNPSDTAPPADPFISDIITVACNDTFYNHQAFPQYSCPGESDCVYINETEIVPDIYHCRPDGGEYANIAGLPIVCNGTVHTWCPKYFVWDEITNHCEFREPVQDSGNMSGIFYPDYQANCSISLNQMTHNYALGTQCLAPDDSDGPPDDEYPKDQVVCRNFSIANYNNTYNFLRPYGFYHDRDTIVY
jgi:hypothetical protein